MVKACSGSSGVSLWSWSARLFTWWFRGEVGKHHPLAQKMRDNMRHMGFKDAWNDYVTSIPGALRHGSADWPTSSDQDVSFEGVSYKCV